jgi:hypothetical protein
MGLKRINEDDASITFRDGDREFTVAKRPLRGTTLASLPGYADGGEVEEKPSREAVQSALDYVGQGIKEGLSPESWHRTISGLVPWPTANSLPAKAIAGVRSLVPGRGTYEEELAAYNAEAPTLGQSMFDAATTLPPGKAVGFAAGALRATKAASKAKKAAKALEVVSHGPAPKAGRGMVAIPWESMSLPEATEFAQNGKHLLRDKTGQYIGAPRGIDTPEKLQAMRAMVDEAVRQGGFNQDWYKRAGPALELVAGGSEQKTDLLARILAITSAGTKQQSNAQMAISAWNRGALEGAEGVRLHPEGFRHGAQQAEAVAAAMENPSSRLGLGNKTGQYYEQLLTALRGSETPRTVNDMQVGRVYGYQNVGKKTGEPFERGFSQAEHSFLTGEQILAGARNGMTPQGAQASEWAAMKLRAGDPMREAYASPAETLKGGKWTANETTEATPGAPGHLEGLSRREDLKMQHARDPRSGFVNEKGYDLFHEANGLLQFPATQRTSKWTNPISAEVERNLATDLHPLLAKKPGQPDRVKGLFPVGDPEAQFMSQTNAWRSTLQGQQQGAWNMPGDVVDPKTGFSTRGITTDVPWGPEGSGQVTRSLMENPNTNDPRIFSKWDKSPQLLGRLREMNALEREVHAKGTPSVDAPRKDLLRLRDVLAREGWTGLAQHVEKHGYTGLPVAVVTSLETIRRLSGAPDEESAP